MIVEYMKQRSSTGMHTKDVYLTRPNGFLLIQRLLDMYVNFYGRSKHSEVGIFNDENVKEFNFIKIFEDVCIYKKVSGSAETYF
jgi:hypothetical protein